MLKFALFKRRRGLTTEVRRSHSLRPMATKPATLSSFVPQQPTPRSTPSGFYRFASKVSQGAKVQNGNDHLFIYGERTAKHLNADHVSESFNYKVALDREYFNGKKVIIFDDVITSGATANEFASQLAECGA